MVNEKTDNVDSFLFLDCIDISNCDLDTCDNISNCDLPDCDC